LPNQCRPFYFFDNNLLNSKINFSLLVQLSTTEPESFNFKIAKSENEIYGSIEDN